MKDSSCVFEIIYQTIRSDKEHLSVSELCKIAGVSRSGYYAWVKAAPIRERQEEEDRVDFELILTAYKMHGYTKGAKGIYMALMHMDPPIIMNLKKIRRLMDKFNLSCPIRRANPYRRMAKALKTSNAADNLLQREFESYGPRMVLLTDITYLPYNGTFAYLSTVLDAFTKEILAYVMSPSLEVDFVLETVNQLVSKDHIQVIGNDLFTESRQALSSGILRGVIDKKISQQSSLSVKVLVDYLLKKEQPRSSCIVVEPEVVLSSSFTPD